MLSKLRTLSDHPVLHVLQNMACYVPGAALLQRSRTVTGAMNEPSVMAEWTSLVLNDAVSLGQSVRDARLLEIGPGHSLGVAFGLLAAGAKEIYVVDVQEFADLSNLDRYEQVVEECKRAGLAPARPEISAANLVPKLSYKIVGHDGRWPVEDASVDLAYSYFAGEHLRHPADVLQETHRVLRSGGACIFAIDLKDHFHRDENWLQFLYYERWLWDAMCSRRGKWSNRVLSPEWRMLFEKYFNVVRFSEQTSPIHPTFDRCRISKEFEKYDLETLSVSGLWIVATKPNGPRVDAQA